MVEDDAARPISHAAVDLDAAIDGAGMHHDDIGLGQCQAPGREAVGHVEFMRGRQQRTRHALVLQSQHHDDVGAANTLGHVVADAHAHVAQIVGRQGLGADGAHLGSAQRGERVNGRACHARMHDVADDGHGEVAEVALEMTDGVHVQQTLGGVGMAAIAGVDDVHMRGRVLGDEKGRAAVGVAHDKYIGIHRFEVGDGVEQALALARAGALDVEIEHVGRQALRRDLEGGAGAGAVLEKQVEHALAA